MINTKKDEVISQSLLERRLDSAIATVQESVLSSLDDLIFAQDDLIDPVTGELWEKIASATPGTQSSPLNTEQLLSAERKIARRLAVKNEYAINVLENRISYVVGTGHQYAVVTRKDVKTSDKIIIATQQVIERFVEINGWQSRQQENQIRFDRDGEVFIRFFPNIETGDLVVRYVEPEQVWTPKEKSTEPLHAMGIIKPAEDSEIVTSYYVDGKPIDADQIQHRKQGVDRKVRRGISIFYPVKRLLKGIESITRNVSIVVAIQSAIAMIRKRSGATASNVEKMITGNAAAQVRNPISGQSQNVQSFPAGTILDTDSRTEYEFPSAKVNPATFKIPVEILLRGVAARMVMPEFMLTSNASNANYSSTMVAEGPVVKLFERLQGTMIVEDKQILWRAIAVAVEAGLLPKDIRSLVNIEATAPNVASRDRLKETKADEILVKTGAMSPQTMGERHGLQPDIEQPRIVTYRATLVVSTTPPGGVSDNVQPGF